MQIRLASLTAQRCVRRRGKSVAPLRLICQQERSEGISNAWLFQRCNQYGYIDRGSSLKYLLKANTIQNGVNNACERLSRK